jgi:hypothetical protein
MFRSFTLLQGSEASPSCRVQKLHRDKGDKKKIEERGFHALKVGWDYSRVMIGKAALQTGESRD